MSSIGLPKGMSRDDAYIQGIADTERRVLDIISDPLITAEEKVKSLFDLIEGATPTCDICGGPEDQDPTNGREYNWNGETGNHLSCEDLAEFDRGVQMAQRGNR